MDIVNVKWNHLLNTAMESGINKAARYMRAVFYITRLKLEILNTELKYVGTIL